MSDCITRVCTKCGVEKPLTSEFFSPRKVSRLGFNTQCRECRRKAARNYPSAKSEKKLLYKSEYGKRPDVTEKRKTKRRERYANDPEYRKYIRDSDTKQKAKNPELTRIKKRDEYQRHKEQYAANEHRRRAIKKQLPATFTAKQWRECLEYWDHKCCVCGRSAQKGLKIAKDHWIAIQDKRPDNPGTVRENILPMCHGINGCNLSKGKRDPVEWLFAKYSELEAKTIFDRINKYFRLGNIVGSDK